MSIFLATLTPFVEIVVIAIIVNYLLSFFWKTRSMDLMLGLVAFFLIFIISSWLKLPILNKIMVLMGNVAVIAILIIFQPELRMALSKLSLKKRRLKEMSTFDKFLEQLTTTVYKMAEKRVGALIALEQEDSLDDLVAKGVRLNAEFSPELLESIFSDSSTLHDGGVIIRGETIVAAAVIFPLSEDSSQIKKLIGTRHRAALGLSQTTDALIIVVSEEKGMVSVAREGMMTSGVRVDRFKGIIRSLFAPQEKETQRTWRWLRR